MKRRLAELAIVVGVGLFALGLTGYGLHASGHDATYRAYTGWTDVARFQMVAGLMMLAGGYFNRRAH